jgi:hypothetical protein
MFYSAFSLEMRLSGVYGHRHLHVGQEVNFLAMKIFLIVTNFEAVRLEDGLYNAGPRRLKCWILGSSTVFHPSQRNIHLYKSPHNPHEPTIASALQHLISINMPSGFLIHRLLPSNLEVVMANRRAANKGKKPQDRDAESTTTSTSKSSSASSGSRAESVKVPMARISL